MKYETITITGSRSLTGWDTIMRQSAALGDIGMQISFLSGQFLGAAYKESTLTGAMGTPEIFVINLQEIDCFTFLDYIEAMRRSSSFSEFSAALKQVRYRSGTVSYETRNHFFTDWRKYNREHIKDVTKQLGESVARKAKKLLNKKADGTCFLPGIPQVRRELSYIPSAFIDSGILDGLRSGDYAGIYSEREGLDVSHAGIIIKDGDRVYLRHASSEPRKRKVVDDDFMEYLTDRPGLIVLRPK